MSVLLIDDHPLYRNGLASLVRQILPDTTILEAGTYNEAESYLKLHDIELALIDLSLPDGSGLALIEKLSIFDPLLPLVVVSAVDDVHTVEQALTLGASGFLPKQLSPDAMINALQKILNGEVYSPLQTTDQYSELPASIGEDLTPRQRDILRLLTQGMSNKMIANKLSIAEKTVKTHLTAIFASLNVNNRAEAIARTLNQRFWI